MGEQKGRRTPRHKDSPQVSRRELIQAFSAFWASGALAGCKFSFGSDEDEQNPENPGAQVQPPGEDVGDGSSVTGGLKILRYQDLCVLEVRFIDLAIKNGALASSGPAPRLVFVFPPQHLFERAFSSSSASGAVITQPIPVLQGGSSRVVVEVPTSELPFSLSEENLLRALAQFPMRLAPNATAAAPASPSEPTGGETALELPARLLLSPVVAAGWQHSISSKAPAPGQRIELWHTRFDVPEADSKLRALWSRPGINDSTDALFRDTNAPLSDADRTALVQQTTALAARAPVQAKLLMLTPLGGYLDAAGVWNPAAPGVTVARWQHRATLGRDQYVQVVTVGYLYPFGHRVVYTEISERKANLLLGIAYLEKRGYISILDEVQDYDTQIPDPKARRRSPFRKIRILTRTTPDLDPPNEQVSDGTDREAVFVPTVDGVPFRFELEGEDQDGRRTRFDAPGVFFRKGSSPATPIENGFVALANELFKGNPVGGRTSLTTAHRNIPLHGRRIAFAPSTRSQPPQAPQGGQAPDLPQPPQASVDPSAMRFDDGAFSVLSLDLGASIVDAGGSISLMPAVAQAEINLEGVSAIAGGVSKALVAPHALYVEHGFSPGANPCEALLSVLPSAGALPRLDFSLDPARIGGFINPSMDVASLSRSLGTLAIPDPTSLANFEPQAIFGLLDNLKLFGVFSLWEVIGLPTQLREIPRLISQKLNQVTGLLFDLYRLSELLAYPELADIPGYNQVINALAQAIEAIEQASSVQPLVALHEALALLSLRAGETLFAIRKEAERLVARLRSAIEPLLSGLEAQQRLFGLIQQFKQGALLPEGATARYVYQPRLKAVMLPGQSEPLFEPGTLTLVAEARLQSPGRPAGAEVTAALENFRLNLVPGLAALRLDVQRLAFRMGTGQKPELDVKFGSLLFDGPMRFLERLKSCVPLDGFSDSPGLDVNAAGVTANFSLALPTVAVGVFSLANVTINAAFNVPFLGLDPLRLSLSFASREQPFALTVSMLGGGGFLLLDAGARGLLLLESALEFGASLSIDLGVASGAVSIAAGVYFSIGDRDDARLEGFLRLRGAVSVLGLINASIELYMALGWAQNKVYGRASLSISIEILFFSTTVSISYERRFSGNNDDPTFEEIMAPYGTEHILPVGGKAEAGYWPWQEYTQAFAPESP